MGQRNSMHDIVIDMQCMYWGVLEYYTGIIITIAIVSVVAI